jgi:hypothetical protein
VTLEYHIGAAIVRDQPALDGSLDFPDAVLESEAVS